MDNADIDSATTLELSSIERWTVFTRLQELSILCHCAFAQPLRVNVETATAALQVWSVTQQATKPQGELAMRLERCWRKTVKK